MLTNNRKFIFNIMSTAILIYGIAMIPSVLMCIRYNEDLCSKTMMVISLICITVGLQGNILLKNNVIYVKPRVSYLTTTSTWALLIILSALPFYLSGEGYSMIDCIFESCAGWSTTGASVISSSMLPVGLQLWRATCNWLGGIGIILLTLIFLPNWQFIGHSLIGAEARGPEFVKDATTFRSSLRRLLSIYMLFTLLQFALLCAAGMRPFHSLLTSLSNISTSGLQHFAHDSIIHFSPAIKAIITVFSYFASLNISGLIMISLGKWKRIMRSTEIKVFTSMILISAVFITIELAITGPGKNIFALFGGALAQVVSFFSTSGYIVTDAHTWPMICKTLLLIITFIGGCAISTAGGIKVARLICGWKTIHFGIYRHIHPHSVKTLQYNKTGIKSAAILQANVYIAVFLLTFLFGAFLLSIDNISVQTAMDTSISMLSNMGTTINDLGGAGTYESFSAFSKGVMSILMIAGRLEIYPLLLLLFKSFWKSESNM